jgi:hypothetical protein
LNEHNVCYVRQIEIDTAEPLVPGPSCLETEIAIAKFKSPGSDEIPAQLNQAGDKILLSAIHKLINFVWNKEELPVHCNNYLEITAINFIQNVIKYPPLKVKSIRRRNHWGSSVWVST